MRSTVSGGGTLVLDGINTMSSNFVNTSIGAVSVAKMGHQGATHATSAVVLEGGVLCLSNSVSENVADRLANSAGIALTGGCLAFVHGSGTADYREALGSLTVVENASVVKIMPAAEGQTATLTFASLARSGHGVVDFQGERLGEDGNVCSRILFVTPPALVNGFIGPWATVNGAAPAMYDAARGVYAAPASAYIDIAARGPDSVIPDNPALNARIVTDGISGPIALETEDGAGVFSLAQESVTSAIVSMAGKTLTTFAVSIAEEGGPLALGEAPGAGELRNGAGLGEILFDNRSAHPLTVHAALSENGSGTMLTKRGSGTVNLEGRVTVSGVTHVAGGELTWGALADSAHVIGSAVEMAGGRETPVSVRINGASQLAGYGDFTVGMRAGDRCVLRLDGGLAVQTSPEKANGRVYVGNGSGVSGAVIQHSGSFNVSTGISGAAFHVLGNGGGYGYHRIMGGALRSGEIAVGGSSSAGDGNASVLDLFGGEITLDAWCLLVAWGKGAGAVNLFGGSFGGTNNGGEVLFAYNNNSAITAQVNLLGAGAKMFDRGSAVYKLINLSLGGTNTLGAVNLNAGELTLFRAHASFGNGTPNTTTPTHFNFNGGLLKAAASTTQFMQGLSAAYVRAGGARIDTDGHAVTLNQPLVAPAGYGVSGIALASAGTGYIGAPAVLVSGGAGVGATAIALVDLEPGSPFCGQVTNILVTAAGSGIDAVAVITPDHWHAIQTIQAAAAGKDIYCQKPLGLTVRDGQEMLKAVRAHRRVLQTGSQWRSTAFLAGFRKAVREGVVGTPRRVVTYVAANNFKGPGPGWQPMPVPDGFEYDMWLGPAPKAPYHKDRCLYRFRFVSDYSGGQTTNFRHHAIGLAMWVLGLDETGPEEVWNMGAEWPLKGDLFDTATKVHFGCRYAGGLELECVTSPKSFGVRIEGDKGWIETNGRKIEASSPEIANAVPGTGSYSEFVNHYRNFIECVKSRGTPIESVEIGHRVSTVCHLGNIAMKLDRKIRWDPKAETIPGDSEAAGMLAQPHRAPWSYKA